MKYDIGQLAHHQKKALQLIFLPDTFAVWMSGGTGSGKSYTASQFVFDMMTCMDPGTRILFLGNSLKINWKNVFLPIFYDRFGALEGSLWTYKSLEGKILFHNTNPPGELVARSAGNLGEVQKLVGESYHHAVLDEPSSYSYLEMALRNVTQRVRAKTKIGNKLLLTGTPKGFSPLTNFFGLKEQHPEEAWTTGYITRTIIDGNKNLNFWVVCGESCKNIYGLSSRALAVQNEIFSSSLKEQELRGQLVSQAGKIFKEFEPYHILPHNIVLDKWKNITKQVCLGMDFGSNTAYVLVGLASDGCYYVINEWISKVREEQVLLEQAAKEVYFSCQKYGNNLLVGDPANNGQVIPELNHYLAKYGLHMHPAQNEWQVGIDLIRNLLAAKKLYLSNACSNLIEEMSRYQLPDNEILSVSNKPLSSLALGSDHNIDSLRYALMELERPQHKNIRNIKNPFG